METKKTLTVAIGGNARSLLDQLAAETGQTKRAIIEQAIERYGHPINLERVIQSAMQGSRMGALSTWVSVNYEAMKKAGHELPPEALEAWKDFMSGLADVYSKELARIHQTETQKIYN